MIITDKHVFFWKELFSQWHESPFIDPTTEILYSHSEQYMMHKKALLMCDTETAELIMNAKHPSEQKKLGRLVKNYDQKLWDEFKFKIVCNASYLKFTQNSHMLSVLLDTGNRILVEASPLDPVWGIGMAENEPDINDPSNWKGENLLGFALTETRDFIKNLIHDSNNLYVIR